MTFHMKDKVVLVTGASGGIGIETARQFADSGARVVIHYNRNLNGAERTLREISPSEHMIIQADITDPFSLQNMVDIVMKKMERIDILVNNAGIFEEHAIWDSTFKEWQASWNRTISTNLLGPANLSYLVINHMISNGGGKIINISSRGAFRGEPDAPAYGASKAGLNALGQSMAKALAPRNIFVFTVAPGFVDTPMAASSLSGPEGDSIRDQSPLGRVATPGEVARTVLFLASEGTEYLTGCIIDINGASYLRT